MIDPIVDVDWLRRHLADVVVCEVGSGSTGGATPEDHRAGHIPGAVNLPFAGNLTGGRFRSTGELRDRFADVVADPTPIVYCGSGVTACHNALAIEHATGVRPRVYVGSWSGWSTDPDRPVATGAA